MFGSAIINKEEKELSYTSLSINGIQQDTFLSFTIKQVFTNTTGERAQVIYFIPNDPQFSMYDLLFIVDKKELKPQICRNEDAAVEEDSDEEIGNGLNSFGLGYVDPDKKVEVHLKVSYLAEINENGYRFKFPLFYKNQEIPLLNNIPENFEFSTTIKSQKEIDEIIASTIGTTNVIDPHNIAFSTKTQPDDDSIIIEARIKDKEKSVAISSDGYISISTYTFFEGKIHANSEFYFIIDCSGSMDGSRIKNAKSCLNILIHSLPIGCRFSIIKFGSHYEVALEPCDYNDENLSKAMDQLNLLDDMGGTNMISPMNYVANNSPKEGYIKQVFLLTDGEDNPERICAMAHENRHNFRIFTIGIGSDANRNLVIDAAGNSGGKYIFIDDNDENMNEKVIELLRLAISYALMHVCIKGERAQTEMWPITCPPLFAMNSQSFIIKSPFVENVVISGYLDNKEITFSIPVSKCNENLGMKQLFCRNMINDYETMYSQNDDPNIVERCVELSLESGVLSKFTSFNGIQFESDDKHVNSSIASEPSDKNRSYYKYPIKPSSSYHNQSRIESSNNSSSLNSEQISSHPSCETYGSNSFKCTNHSHGCRFDMFYCIISLIYEILIFIFSFADNTQKTISYEVTPVIIAPEVVPKASNKINSKECEFLISNQNADGSWNDFERIDQKIKSKYGHKVASTVAAIAYIRTICKDNMDQYSLLIKKALSFLNNQDKNIDWNEMINKC